MNPNEDSLNSDCERFRERMHSLLDQRIELEGDDELNEHADRCDACREAMNCWSEVHDLVLRPATTPSGTLAEFTPKTIGIGSRLAISVAASLMLILTVGRFVVRSSQSGDRVSMSTEFIDSLSPNAPGIAAGNQDSIRITDSTTNGPGNADWNSGSIWNAVADDQWVQQTLPAVNSVGRGVAPIGRSMRQAFVLLLIQGQGGSIQSSTNAPNLPQQSFDEQTSQIESVRVYMTMV